MNYRKLLLLLSISFVWCDIRGFAQQVKAETIEPTQANSTKNTTCTPLVSIVVQEAAQFKKNKPRYLIEIKNISNREIKIEWIKSLRLTIGNVKYQTYLDRGFRAHGDGKDASIDLKGQLLKKKKNLIDAEQSIGVKTELIRYVWTDPISSNYDFTLRKNFSDFDQQLYYFHATLEFNYREIREAECHDVYSNIVMLDLRKPNRIDKPAK